MHFNDTIIATSSGKMLFFYYSVIFLDARVSFRFIFLGKYAVLVKLHNMGYFPLGQN